MDLISDFAGKPVKIAFVGSCITEGFGLANPDDERFSRLFCNWFSDKFVNSQVIEMNLGYPRNSSIHLSVYFMEAILKEKPDILLLEIAGEDWHLPSESGRMWLETAIRLIRTHLPSTFIFNIYPYGGFLTKHYQGLERHQLDKWYRPIMNTYGIPTIDVGQYLWKGEQLSKWAIDDLMQDARWHPNNFGHAAYAKALTDFIEENIFAIEHKSVPARIDGNFLIDTPRTNEFSPTGGWKKIPWNDYGNREFNLFESFQKGVPLFGIFRGSVFGLYWLSTKSSGKIAVSIDGGKQAWLIDLWNKSYAQNPGLNGSILTTELTNDVHTFSIIAYDSKNEKSEGYDVSLAYYFTGNRI